MVDSIERKALLTAIAIVAPPVLVIVLYVPNAAIRVCSVVLGIVFIVVAWLLGRSVSGRIRRLTDFADRLLNTNAPHPVLPSGDDELGVLARSLMQIAPQVEELVNRLGTELSRREAILASMTDAVLAVDSRLIVTFCNNAFVQAIGDHQAPEGVPLIRVVRDPVLLEILTQVLATGQPVRKRLQLSTTEVRTYDVTGVPLTTTSPGALAILHDATPGERLERIKRDFIANVSHEIRTPLATIRGYAETLLDGGLDDENNRRRFVEVIQANGVRLNNIAADLLTLSELESGQAEAQAGKISLNDALSGAIRAVEPAASLTGVHLRADPIPQIYLLGYGLRLEQALLNLLDNAVKFNKPNGEVFVHVEEKSKDLVEIRISDTGLGIPGDDLTRIFERFYRVDKARSRQVGGTGLGLSIVKHAIEQMGGTVTVESKLGVGSTFIVTLPQYSSSRKPVLTASS